MIRITFFCSRYDTACAIARYVLPVPAGPDAEDDVVLLDGVEVAALIDALGRHLAAARRPRGAAHEVVAQLDVAVLRHQLRGRLHVAVGNAVALLQEARQLAHGPLDADLVVRRTLDEQVAALGADAHAEGGFELAEVLVVGPEEGLDAILGN